MLIVTENLKIMNDIHSWLNLCQETHTSINAYAKVKVDLSNLKYISPIGCITLLSTLKYLDRYFQLDTIAPKVTDIAEPNVISYIERMNFFRLCPPDVCKSFEQQIDMEYLYSRSRNDTSSILNEITLCTDYEDVEKFDESLKEILRRNGVSQNRVSHISRIVTELGLNSVEHGKNNDEVSCYYCIQKYRDRIELAICDNGEGIVNSLKNSLKKYASTHDIVKQAVLTNASRHLEQERGKGLPDVQKVALKLENTDVYLRTHDSVYQITNKKVRLMDKGTYFCGTYYYLVIFT